VGRIQALSQDTSTDEADDITKDLIAAFRVFDRDCNGYITKVQYLGLMSGHLCPEEGDSRLL
jgi:Ca2+-binding EF-hand superfamily protein